ncbi:hypothetical protein BsWGS_25121 [Bradybaena similaris]
MRVFIGVLLLMGLTRQSSFNLYWTTDRFLEMLGFREIISRDRFLSILSVFHVVDNSKQKPRDHPEYDKSFKIRPLLNMLLPLWQKYFHLQKEISVDESMIPFKGRTSYMQYMPKKPHKWGLKAWGLADARTGYMWNWQLYVGKEDRPNAEGKGLAHRVVAELAEPLYGKGHVLYMDNFFSSSPLFQELANNQMGACGTIRTNRKGVPDAIKKAKLRPGQPPVTARDQKLLYISWYDKRAVNLATTAHTDEMFEKTVRSKHHPEHRRVVNKLCAVEAYTQHMGGVDRADKQMTHYMMLHRNNKWWKKVFFYLFEVTFCNILVIWKALRGTRVNAEQFRLKVAHHLLDGYRPGTSSRKGRKAENPPDRIIMNDHFPGINPKRLPSGKPSRPDCIVCTDRDKKRHQTQYICKKCNVPLCLFPCFERYHTLVNYKVECTADLHQ